MKLLYLKRRGGKTTKALAECRKTGATLVVLNQMLANSYRKQYPDVETISHNEFLRSDRQGRLTETFIIDDVDHMLIGIAQGRRVCLVTMSKPFTKSDCKKYGLPLDCVGRT